MRIILGIGSGVKRNLIFSLMAAGLLVHAASSQTVNIKFRYQPQASYVRVHFPGVFNNWGPNTSGTILAGAPSQADSLEAATGLWVKTTPIAFGTYQYKIYRQITGNPTDWSWISDPLNRVVIQPDQNSQFVVDSLVLLQVCAYPYTVETNAGGTNFVVKTGTPKLSAGIFQPSGAPAVVLTALVDGAPVSNPMSLFDGATGIFTYQPSQTMPDGNHVFSIAAVAGGQSRVDSVKFEVRARTVQIQTPSFSTHKSVYVTAGFILNADGSGPDTVSSVTLTVNGVGKTIVVSGGNFSDSTSLAEGLNVIKVITSNSSDSVAVTRIVNHTPFARTSALLLGSVIQLSGLGSTDPDTQTIASYKWLDDPATPLGLNGKTAATVQVSKPSTKGEYYFGLIATDPDGNADTTRSYFIINADGTMFNPNVASNPEWAKRGRIYFLFPKAFTRTGTINAAAQKLQYIKDLGFNIIWMMPVMKNASPINQGSGPGYNITDFYTVAPEYGTNQDFKDFITQAHALGIRVILDVTPNHTSRFHPWSADAHANKLKSPYWNWYEHTAIPHNTNGLGQSFDADGFNYYSGFSDQLLNFNWKDVDAQLEMINVFKFWVRTTGLDGYRFDVYWGPHRRYGEQYMGKPVRDALKHIKPDILLLGEDDGTGSGTEVIYADRSTGGINGGLDAAYDFKLYFNQIRGFAFTAGAVNNLDGDVSNAGFFPGPNSLYMRFLESQDEDRIVSFYNTGDPTSTFLKTMPMASVIFTVPGIPMIWNGQEVGWGYGIAGSKEARNRSTINWDFQGKGLLTPHYERLASIRGLFPAFSSQTYIRLGTGNGLVYGLTRPYDNANGIALMNFDGSASPITINLTTSGTPNISIPGGAQDGKTYFMNDVYNDTSYAISFLNGSVDFSTTLPAYGSAVYVLADTLIKLKLPTLTEVGSERTAFGMPTEFSLGQNFPNPFNPMTHLRFAIADVRFVQLRVFDMLGREIVKLVDQRLGPGNYEVAFDGSRLSSGVYFYQLNAGNFSEMKKMMLIK